MAKLMLCLWSSKAKFPLKQTLKNSEIHEKDD